MEILQKGGPARAKLDSIEARITEITEELRATEVRPPAIDEVIESIRRDLGSGSMLWRTVFQEVMKYTSRDREVRAEAPHSLLVPITLFDLATLLGEGEFLKRLQPIIASRLGDAAMPSAKRAERIAALQKEARQLAAEAELETMTLERAGHYVLRREDVDLPTLFEVWARQDAAAARPRAAASH
jgi:hypothetical protein